MKKLLILLLSLCGIATSAQPEITSRPQGASDFALFAGGRACGVFVDAADHEAVKTVAELFAGDIGRVTVYAYALPLFPVDSKRDTRYGVMIDDGMVQWMTTDAKEYSSQWRLNVFRNSAVSAFSFNIDKPGRHTLRLICADPGVIVQKVVIDFGGMKRSYLGPDVTYVK